MAATFGHCWQMAGEQEHGRRGAQCTCLCKDPAQCLLPVVLMPPAVQELQAQRAGHFLGLNTAVLFFPSIIISVPPAVSANRLHLLSFSNTDICRLVYMSAPLYRWTAHTCSLCWPLLTAPVIKCCCCAISVSCHIYPICPLNWNSGRLRNRSCPTHHGVKKTKKSLVLDLIERQICRDYYKSTTIFT